MQVTRAPARIGWRWVLEGFSLLRRHPLALLGLTVLFLFSVMLPSVLPVIGQFAPLVLMPALSVGYMQAVRTSAAGRMPGPWTLYDGLRAQKGRGARPLLMLGAINCLLTVAALACSSIADGGTLFRIATGTISADDPALGQRDLAFAAIIFLLLYTPVQMAMWYAPVFVALQLLRPLLPGSLMPLLLSPLSLVMLAALYCSFWPSYRDVVEDDADAGPPPLPPLPSQL